MQFDFRAFHRSHVLNSSLQLARDHLPSHPETIHCASCNAEAHGEFCSHCGAATEIEVPSASEFVHEFIGHYVALEGKLWRTLQRLMLCPGLLTLDYLAGRRAFLVNPLRLYLTLSLVVFALIKMVGIELPQLTIEEDSAGVSYRHVAPEKTATLYLRIDFMEDEPEPGKLAANGKLAAGAGAGTKQAAPRPSTEAIDDAIEAVGKLNPTWMGNLKGFMREPAKGQTEILNRGFLTYLPYMLIGALPLFALYLKLIYWRCHWRYGEHLVFALHANAFAFLLASLMIIVPGNAAWMALCLYNQLFSLISIWDCLQVIPFLWLVLYLPAAMRRVYGGSRLATGGRWLALITVHLAVISILTVAAELIGILKHG